MMIDSFEKDKHYIHKTHRLIFKCVWADKTHAVIKKVHDEDMLPCLVPHSASLWYDSYIPPKIKTRYIGLGHSEDGDPTNLYVRLSNVPQDKKKLGVVKLTWENNKLVSAEIINE